MKNRISKYELLQEVWVLYNDDITSGKVFGINTSECVYDEDTIEHECGIEIKNYKLKTEITYTIKINKDKTLYYLNENRVYPNKEAIIEHLVK